MIPFEPASLDAQTDALRRGARLLVAPPAVHSFVAVALLVHDLQLAFLRTGGESEDREYASAFEGESLLMDLSYVLLESAHRMSEISNVCPRQSAEAEVQEPSTTLLSYAASKMTLWEYDSTPRYDRRSPAAAATEAQLRWCLRLVDALMEGARVGELTVMWNYGFCRSDQVTWSRPSSYSGSWVPPYWYGEHATLDAHSQRLKGAVQRVSTDRVECLFDLSARLAPAPGPPQLSDRYRSVDSAGGVSIAQCATEHLQRARERQLDEYHRIICGAQAALAQHHCELTTMLIGHGSQP